MLCTLLALFCPDETISGYAEPTVSYALVEMAEADVALDATISFPEEGVVQGRGPCNTFTAAQSLPYPWISIGPVKTTRAACPELASETAFLAALERATLAEVQGPTLILSTVDEVLLVFRAK
ncbi:hypothetical protein JANAI62_02950 [Jannaschia pagri]|uniref:DUF306 domain-containing protein n=1 Tax=Jannaschia pagri TaxID=2829797 RepID=A0ABQ4NHW4_9RHOB|nr:MULTISPECIES: META domain-containing protein [unclassified Jannaschia]GIT90222.1 hypothetical protein JANAI61_06800 [Jannaschia sp. AI_61]GIT93672.1 hypothetical protein JANAI62_02950 [Jannaschia sp. AI_62]